MDMCHDELAFSRWFERSFAYEQGRYVDFEQVREYLLSNGCINEDGNITDFGRISVCSYFKPDILKEVEERLINLSLEEITDFIPLSFVISPCVQLCHVYADVSDGLDEYCSDVRSFGYVFPDDEKTRGFNAYCALSKKVLKPIRHAVLQTRKDLGRIFMAMKRIASIHGDTYRKNRLEIAEYMSKYCAPFEVASIGVKFGLKLNDAIEMRELKINSMDDLKSISPDAILTFSDRLKLALIEKGFLKNS